MRKMGMALSFLIVIAVVAVAMKEMPALRRYIKIERM